MKLIILLWLIPVFTLAQTKIKTQLVAFKINYEPDQTTSATEYFLIADKPSSVNLKQGQTFVLQNAWHKEGDSAFTIGAGTVSRINADNVELHATILANKKVSKGDMAMFLIPLMQPKNDTLFFKLARYDINFISITDSDFYNRNTMLKTPGFYNTNKILADMVNDVRYTGKAMAAQDDSQEQLIKTGFYKGQKLFALMQKINIKDVLQFIRYVYFRPDKYRSQSWHISETIATWLVNGAPTIKL